MPQALAASFFERDAATVARDLLGKILVSTLAGPRSSRVGPGAPRRAAITETEAYVGAYDLASHAAKGKTTRNASMFGKPGRAYVYVIYGIHPMLNVVAGSEGDPQAVLVRAARPLDGWTIDLSGPGRLARGFGVTKALDGHDLRTAPLWIQDGPAVRRVETTPRVGVGYARHWAQAPLRFVATDLGAQ